MTRKITNQSEEEETVIDAGFEDMSGLKDDQDEAEAAILAQFDADEENIEWTASIYEVGTGGEKDGWLFDCSMGDITGVRQKLLDVYGTGLYRARIRRGNRLARFLTYRIVAPRLGPQVTTTPEINPLAIAVADQGRLLEKLVEKLGETPPVPVQNNPMEMMDIMGRMMETMGRFTPQNQTPAMDPLQLFELFKSGFEMASDKDGGSETNILDVVKELIKSPLLKDLTTVPPLGTPQIAAPVKQPEAGTAEPKPASPAPVQAGEVATPLTNDPVVIGVVGYMKGFIEKAEKNSDPGLYTDFILDNVEMGVIAHVVNTPNIADILRASDPGIEKNWAWFADLLTLLQDAVAEEAAEKVADHEAQMSADHEGQTGETLTPVPDDDKPGKTISGEVIPSDVSEKPAKPATTKPAPQPTAGGKPSNGDPKRKGGDKSNPADNVKTGKLGKKAPGRKNKSRATGGTS